MSNGVITGDATGDLAGSTIRIAPKLLVEKNTDITLSYTRALPDATTFINQTISQAQDKGEIYFTADIGDEVTGDLDIYVTFGAADLQGSALVHLKSDTAGTGLKVESVLSSGCLLYTSPSPRDKRQSRMPSSA